MSQIDPSKIPFKSGDIILFRYKTTWNDPSTWVSWCVRKLTKCYYNHVSIVVSNWEILEINESLFEGVVGRPLEKFINRHNCQIKVMRAAEGTFTEREICVRANSAKGKKYDFKNLLFYQLVYRLFGRWLSGKGSQEKKMVCSEYVAWCFNLDEWWKYSTAELEKHSLFHTIYVSG